MYLGTSVLQCIFSRLILLMNLIRLHLPICQISSRFKHMSRFNDFHHRISLAPNEHFACHVQCLRKCVNRKDNQNSNCGFILALQPRVKLNFIKLSPVEYECGYLVTKSIGVLWMVESVNIYGKCSYLFLTVINIFM